MSLEYMQKMFIVAATIVLSPIFHKGSFLVRTYSAKIIIKIVSKLI